MSNLIKDGKGRGYLAEVTQDQRLRTESTILTNMYSVSIDDQLAFFATTGFVPLTTTTSFSGVMYVKNTSATKNLHIVLVRPSEDVLTAWKFIVGPTGGTLISNAVAATTTNANGTSPRGADALVYQGADGDTVTGGIEATHFYSNVGGNAIQLDGSVLLPVNGTFAFVAKPSAVANVNMTLMFYFNDNRV